MERENLCFVTSEDVKGQAASGSNREGESTEARRRGGAARSSVEGPVMGLERRGCVVRPWPLANRKREEPVGEAKPFKQRPNIGSRVTREGHARFWERPEVKFVRATRRLRSISPLNANGSNGWFADLRQLSVVALSVPDRRSGRGRRHERIGHELSRPIDGRGHRRGWQPGSKVSMMIIRPPQQGQAFQSWSTRPFSAASGSRLDGTGLGTLRSRRANAILFARLALAKRP